MNADQTRPSMDCRTKQRFVEPSFEEEWYRIKKRLNRNHLNVHTYMPPGQISGKDWYGIKTRQNTTHLSPSHLVLSILPNDIYSPRGSLCCLNLAGYFHLAFSCTCTCTCP